MASESWTLLSFCPDVCHSCGDCRKVNKVLGQAWPGQETIHTGTEAGQACFWVRSSYQLYGNLFLLLYEGSDLRRRPQALDTEGLQVITNREVSMTMCLQQVGAYSVLSISLF